MTQPTILESVTDLLPRLYDLHHQATVERSHYYVGAMLREVITVCERIQREHVVGPS
jgi:hypothetical protein